MIEISKESEMEFAVPVEFRALFKFIADKIAAGDFDYAGSEIVIAPVAKSEQARILGNIEEYGEALVSLPEETWETSVCVWTGRCWRSIVDLYTRAEGSSDLSLFVDVFEEKSGLRAEVHSVHVA